MLYGGWEIAGPAKWPEWVIIGAMTGPGAKKHQPKAEWVADIVAQCKAAGVPVFMKESLVPVVEMVGGKVIREYPSAAAAAREHGLSAPGMSRRISKGVIKDGRSWVYKGE